MFDAPQVKRDMISSRIKFVYELSLEFPIDLRRIYYEYFCFLGKIFKKSFF